MSHYDCKGWLIYKIGRGWYRPKAAGYTMNPAEAGRYSYIEALRYSHPNGLGGPRDGMTIKHEGDVPGAIASARIMGDKGRENPAERPYTFDRYVGGKLMAEGITIEREATLESAIAKAIGKEGE